MHKRNDDLLTSRLEDAADEGMSFILWSELYRWYETKKIAAGTRRDLAQRWDELTNGQHGDLQQIESRGGIYIFGSKSPEPIYED